MTAAMNLLLMPERRSQSPVKPDTPKQLNPL